MFSKTKIPFLRFKRSFLLSSSSGGGGGGSSSNSSSKKKYYELSGVSIVVDLKMQENASA